MVDTPPHTEHLDRAGIRLEQALEDLDGRGLARAVRAEQPETLAGPDLQVEAGDGHYLAVAFDQTGTAHNRRRRLFHWPTQSDCDTNQDRRLPRRLRPILLHCPRCRSPP